MLIRAPQNNRTLPSTPSTWLSVALEIESFRRYYRRVINLIKAIVRGGPTCFPRVHEPYATHPSESHACTSSDRIGKDNMAESIGTSRGI